MYGSYGSYSSMGYSQAAMPMDIGSTGSTTACAFPSWPRSASLADSHFGSSSSYLSDEDLFLDDFDDNASATSSTCSRSNSNASSVSPPHNCRQPEQPFALPAQLSGPSDEELLQRQRERQAYQRDLVRGVLLEKERRKQAASAARRHRRAAAAEAAGTTSTTANTSSRKKSSKLTMISEDA